MASAREYSNLTGSVRRDVVAMVEKAVSQKRKGEGLIVHGSQCRDFIDRHLVTVRETSYFDGVPQRAMTLVSSLEHPENLELTLDTTMVSLEGQAATKAAKKWGNKKAGGGDSVPTPSRSRQRSSDRLGGSSSSKSIELSTLVLETERVLRARRDASVVVTVRERDAERERASTSGKSRSAVQETPSWSSVNLTAEDIFRQCNGKWWVGDKDREYVYCVVKQSCNVDKDFPEFLSAIQLHLYGVMKLQGLQ